MPGLCRYFEIFVNQLYHVHTLERRQAALDVRLRRPRNRQGIQRVMEQMGVIAEPEIMELPAPPLNHPFSQPPAQHRRRRQPASYDEEEALRRVFIPIASILGIIPSYSQHSSSLVKRLNKVMQQSSILI